MSSPWSTGSLAHSLAPQSNLGGPVDRPALVRELSGRPRERTGRVWMTQAGLAQTIDAAFDNRNDVGPATKGPVRDAVEAALDLLDRGEARVAEKAADGN